MAFLDQHLSNNETILYRFRPSRKAFLLEYIAFVIALAINLIIIYPILFSELDRITTIILEIIGYAMGIITLLILIRVEYKVWLKRYALTTQRLMTSKGILREDFKSSIYAKMTDIGLKQSLFDKIMNTGTLYINTAGGDDIELRLENISKPLFIKKRISDMQSQINTSQIKHQHHHSSQQQHLNKHNPKIHQKRS